MKPNTKNSFLVLQRNAHFSIHEHVKVVEEDLFTNNRPKQ